MRYPLDKPNFGQPFAGELADYSQFGLLGHNGQDFPEPTGTKIYAISDGFLVEAIGKTTGYGIRVTQYLEIEGKPYLAIYGHMESLNIPEVDYNFKSQIPVKEGDVIGFVDSTGYSSGPHLHLGLYPMDSNGNKLFPNNGYGGAVNPLPYLNALKVKDNNMFVKTMNYNGTVGLFIQADTPDHLKFLGTIFSKTIQVNPDNSITTESTVVDKP